MIGQYLTLTKKNVTWLAVLLVKWLIVLPQAEIAIQTGHPGHRMLGSCFSPDGQYFLTYDEMGTYIFRETSNGQELRRMDAAMQGMGDYLNEYHDEYRYFSLPSISAQNDYCITLGKELGIYDLWSLRTGKLVKEFNYLTSDIQGNCQSVLFSVDGRSVLLNVRNRTGNCLYRVLRYDIASGREETLFDFQAPIRPDGKGEQYYNWPRCVVAAMNASHDLRTFAMGMIDGRVLIIDRAARRMKRTGAVMQEKDMLIITADELNVNQLAFLPDGASLITRTMNQVDLWDVRKGTLLRRIKATPCELKGVGNDKTEIFSFVLSENCRMMALHKCLGPGETVKLLTTIDVYTGQVLRRDTPTFECSALSNDGLYAFRLSASYRNSHWEVYNTQTDETLGILENRAMLLTNAGFFNNGKSIYIGTIYSNAWLIDLEDAKVSHLRNFTRLSERDTLASRDLGYYNYNIDKGLDGRLRTVYPAKDGQLIFATDFERSPCTKDGCDSSFFIWDAHSKVLKGAGRPYIPWEPPYSGIKRFLPLPDNDRIIVNHRVWSRSTRKYQDFDGMTFYHPFLGNDPKVFYNLTETLKPKPLYFEIQTVDASTLHVIKKIPLQPSRPFPTVVEPHTDINTMKTQNETVDCENEFSILSKDGNILMTAMELGLDGLYVFAWDFNTGRELARFGLKGQRHEYGTAVYDLDISSDNSMIAVGAYDKNIYVLQLANGKLLYTLKGHNSAVHSVAFAPNGRYLVSTSTDRTCRLWDLQQGRELLSFSTYGLRDYVLRDSDGYYMGTRGGAKSVLFVKDQRSYSFDQFDLQYNRPDKILSHLKEASPAVVSAYERAWRKRLKKMEFDTTALTGDRSFDVPKVDFVQLPPKKTPERAIRCQFLIRDSLAALERLNVYVNGVPLYGKRGSILRGAAGQSLRKEIEIPLSAGRNRIEVSAMNAKGVESNRQKMTVECTAVAERNLYLICIGVSRYKNPNPNLQLRYAAKDARNIDSLFRSHSKKFNHVYSHLLLNEDVNREKVLNLRKELLKTTTDDEVLVFYAGHGLVDDSLNYFLATYDMDFSRPSLHGLPYETFEALLDSIPARSKICLVDACHSGELDKEEARLVASQRIRNGAVQFRAAGDRTIETRHVGLGNSLELMKQLFVDLRRSTGATVISSAGGGQYAWEGGKVANGIFAYCVLSGLGSQKADLNADGVIMLSELRDYVQQQVAELTDGNQLPTSRTENYENDLVIW